MTPLAPRLAFAVLPLLLLAGLFAPGPASAEVRAWLDRDRIELGETATLNIETDGGGRPDYAPLEREVRLGQRSSRQSWERHGGRQVSRTLYAVAVRPERAGTITLPALQVGGERTAPLVLTVEQAPAGARRAQGPVWLEAELDDATPYVQQAVGLRLRLYYAVQLVSGQLDQRAPDSIALQRAGGDLQYTREIGGRRYQVVERRYVLVPERSGRVELPPATFRGRGVGGWLDDLFGDGQRPLSADGPALALDVAAVPDAAPRPWLPLRGLELRWTQRPDAAREGDAAIVELEVVADGATAAQLDAPAITADQGAQVFPEPPQHDETVEDGRPRVRMVRRYAVLPARAGPLRIEGPRLRWWDVEAGRVREAALPPITLDVAPAAAGAATGAAPGTANGAGTWVRVPGVQGEVHAWALATVVFALLWLLTLAWALQWRQRASAGGPSAGDAAATDAAVQARVRVHGLRKALDTGDAGDVAAALRALASPPAADLDALSRMLAPGPQREAIALLQQARWGQGGAGIAEARVALRAAFSGGPDWRVDGDAADGALPPLYPR